MIYEYDDICVLLYFCFTKQSTGKQSVVSVFMIFFWCEEEMLDKLKYGLEQMLLCRSRKWRIIINIIYI